MKKEINASKIYSLSGRVCLNTADYHRLDFKDDRLNFKTCKPLELDGKFKLEGSTNNEVKSLSVRN